MKFRLRTRGSNGEGVTVNVTLPDDVTDGEQADVLGRDVWEETRVAARPTTPPKTLARAFPLASDARERSLEETRAPTSRMRCASHSSSPRGVGRGTETRAARRRETRFENEGGALASRRNGGAKEGVSFLVNAGRMFSATENSFASSSVRVSVRSALRDACHVAGASLARVARPARFERGVADDARFREDVPARVSDRRARARAFFSRTATESRRDVFESLERNAPVTRVSLNEPRGDARDARGEDRRSRWKRARTDANNCMRLMRAWVSPLSSRRAVAGRRGRPTPRRDGPNTGCAEKGGACGFARGGMSWSKRVPSVDGSRDARRTTCTATGVRAISEASTSASRGSSAVPL